MVYEWNIRNVVAYAVVASTVARLVDKAAGTFGVRYPIMIYCDYCGVIVAVGPFGMLAHVC